MSNNYKRTLVTSALPYANGPVHIGHLAGCYLPSDIFVRFKRSKAILHKLYKRYVRNINPLLVENNNPDQKPQELSFQEK